MVKARQLIESLGNEFTITTSDLGWAGVEVTVNGKKVNADAKSIRAAAGARVFPSSRRRSNDHSVVASVMLWDGRSSFRARRNISGAIEVEYSGSWYATDVCGGRCGMCRTILNRLYIARKAFRELTSWQPKIGQEPSSVEAIESLMRLLELDSSAVFVDIGAADGRVVSAAAKTCKSIGVELDPEAAKQAQRLLSLAGLQGKARIFQGDAIYFDPQKFKVTHGYAHLMPDTLEKLKPMLKQIPVLVTSHPVPGWTGEEVDGFVIYKKG